MSKRPPLHETLISETPSTYSYASPATCQYVLDAATAPTRIIPSIARDTSTNNNQTKTTSMEHSTTRTTPPLSTEPILQPNNNRFVLYPIKHYEIWKIHKKALASFWVPEEIDLSHDIMTGTISMNMKSNSYHSSSLFLLLQMA